MGDLYRVLGVSRSASPQALKLAYRTKTRNCPNDSESLEALNMAYAILISSELRAECDAFQDMGDMKWSIRRGVDIMDRGIVLSGSFSD